MHTENKYDFGKGYGVGNTYSNCALFRHVDVSHSWATISGESHVKIDKKKNKLRFRYTQSVIVSWVCVCVCVCVTPVRYQWWYAMPGTILGQLSRGNRQIYLRSRFRLAINSVPELRLNFTTRRLY